MLKKGILFIYLVLSFSIYLFSQNLSYIIDEDGVRRFHEGSLIIKENVPFLTVNGNPYEVGLQYGVLLNDYLLKMDKVIDSLIVANTGQFFIKKWIVRGVLNRKIKEIEKKVPSEYLLEMRGMADGSDLDLKDLQIIAYVPQLFFKISCTAFIAKNVQGIVHGRNLDWPGIEILTHFPLIVNYHITNKIPFTNLTFIGYPGVYTGMNHSGLSLSINMNGAPAEYGKKISDYNTGMPLAYKVRNMLENAENLTQVDEQFRNYSSHAWFITAGSNFDKSGTIYELTRGGIIKNDMQDDFLFVENLSISDKGRFMYSPIWMFGNSNISRERKIKELYDRFNDLNLVDKSYNILINTENHNLSHDPYFGYCINNYNTIKSCILDNTKKEIYFTYGEHNAALNKYLHYTIETGEVTVYKSKQEIADSEYYSAAIDYNTWYNATFAQTKKLSEKNYQLIIDEIQKYNLQPAYKALELSNIYLKLKDYENAYIQAENYITDAPDYYPAYYQKYRIVREKGDNLKAIVTLEEMLQTSTINPYYEYRAKVNMIEMYDKLLENKTDPVYIEKILNLYAQIKSDIIQYFVDTETQKDLDLIEKIVKKYN
ncbi:MAG: C45 family autoproteolytic acyltransferase/hydrolase [Bacteroidales bacterium]